MAVWKIFISKEKKSRGEETNWESLYSSEGEIMKERNEALDVAGMGMREVI